MAVTRTSPREDIINEARTLHASDGVLEVYDDAKLSMGDEAGVYVSAWAWVESDDDEAETVAPDSDDAVIESAREQHEDAGTCEIGDDAVISEGSDSGAYVEIWVWVDFEENEANAA